MTPEPQAGAAARLAAGPAIGPAIGAVALAPYDGVLLQSFGGPERPQDVMPFLENVARGRAIPRERLEAVAEHYYAFGGRSPINDQNRALLDALGAELSRRGLDLPLYWGNRNWQPFLPDALREARAGGARRLVTVVTSAYSSYSGCRQYSEDLAAALAELATDDDGSDLQSDLQSDLRPDLQVDKVRHYFNLPGFVAANADAVVAAFEQLDSAAAVSPRFVFVTHSIPVSMARRSGPEGGAYAAQHLDAAAAVMDVVSQRLGRSPGWDLVYCSRSGSPRVPWLEPDINDHLLELARVGASGVVVAPIGFVSDHMEVVFDLDTEAAGFADRLGLRFARAATVGTHPAFVSGLVDLLLERAAQARDEPVDPPAVGSLGAWPARCPQGCCAKAERPA